MSQNSIVGLFYKTEKLEKEIRENLINNHFQEENFLIKEDPEDILLFSLALNNEDEKKVAKEIFEKFLPAHIYEFGFVAENKDRIRNYIDAAAKTEIFNLPKLKEHGHHHDGLNSELIIGE